MVGVSPQLQSGKEIGRHPTGRAGCQEMRKTPSPSQGDGPGTPEAYGSACSPSPVFRVSGTRATAPSVCPARGPRCLGPVPSPLSLVGIVETTCYHCLFSMFPIK